MKNKINFKVCSQVGNPEAYAECEAFIVTMQKIMKLQDWSIKLYFISANEINEVMESPDYLAYCQRCQGKREARIYINCEHPQINDCIEQTIIHEMCHITTGFFWDAVKAKIKDSDATIDELMEYSIEDFSLAIYNALIFIGD